MYFVLLKWPVLFFIFYFYLTCSLAFTNQRERVTEREKDREGERITSSVFLLGSEAWMNILLVTIIG